MASSVRKLDRISNLHDSILCHILSFLTTKESVGTSILSTRWQYLWASVPVLDFDEGLIIRSHHNMSQDEMDELSIMFRAFVNRVLLLSDVSSLGKFHLRLDNTHPGFDSWVRTAIRRNVVELSLNILDVYDYARLPTILYTSQTLVVLKLFSNIIIDPPATVWLPNLKVLELESDHHEYVFPYQNLWSGCPVLEELLVVCRYGGSFNVSVPTLKRLNFEVHVEDMGYFLEEHFYEVIIDAPNLKHLEISDGQLTRFTLLNLSSLLVAKASIFIEDTVTNPSQLSRYAGHFFQLLNGIANAKHLSLSLRCWTLPGLTMSCFTNGSSYVAPAFHRLTSLMLDTVDSCGWQMQYAIIECTPKLEVLHINKICKNVESWSPPRGVPACLQSCLKEIWIKIFEGKKYELKAIAYFLKNAETLRKMTINCRRVRKEQYHVCKKLSQFPKASTHCLLNLVT